MRRIAGGGCLGALAATTIAWVPCHRRASQKQPPPLAASPPLLEGAGGSGDVVTPWVVAAKGPRGINYDRVLKQFKAKDVGGEVVEQLMGAVGRHVASRPPAAHHFFTRKIAFAHRDLDRALSEVAGLPPLVARQRLFLYTGRGPSGRGMHLGHAIPFLLVKYLQDALGLPLVIQITDDEKFLFRGAPFAGAAAAAAVASDIKDIVAFGFHPARTFIFRNTAYMGELYPTVLALQRAMTGSAVKNTLGLSDSDNIGKFGFPATQAAPCFSAAFPRVLPDHGGSPRRCLVVCAIDQDPLFVLARAAAARVGEGQPPPALLFTKFLPALKGLHLKMSSSAEHDGVITLHDSDDQLRSKLRRAFSGGRPTLAEMQVQGADLDVDVAYQFLRFFCGDDVLLEDVAIRYAAGRMSSVDVKDLAASVVIATVLQEWRERRASLTDGQVQQFCRVRDITT